MKLWILLLGLLIVACAAAFGWQMLAADPGYVLIRLGNTRVETTFIFAVVALLVLWGVVSLLSRAARWPFRAWSHRTQRRGRERIAAGLTALAEGRYGKAMRDLERASHQTGLRAPALLAAARAAHASGEPARADASLDEAAETEPAAALALRARFLVEQGKPDVALELLTTAQTSQGLAPSSQRLMVEAALLCGDHAVAMQAVDALGRNGQLAAATYDELQARVVAASLKAAASGDQLNALWTGLPRAQRTMPVAIEAYARRAAEFGLVLPALDELESALRRSWSEALIRTYGDLGEAETDMRLRRAESWLDLHPNSPGLLLALGRLCNQAHVWGKAREYLERGLALEPSPALWEALGECCIGQDQPADAVRCMRNSLRSARDESVESIAQSRAALDTRASAVEQRTEHGVPRLAITSAMPTSRPRE
ncbi:MAG: heme biosynthesis HemY N-terminal domain-containing protein [Rudaea sp.]